MWARNAIKGLGFGCMIRVTQNDLNKWEKWVHRWTPAPPPAVCRQSAFLMSWSGFIDPRSLFQPPCLVFRNQKGTKLRRLAPLSLWGYFPEIVYTISAYIHQPEHPMAMPPVREPGRCSFMWTVWAQLRTHYCQPLPRGPCSSSPDNVTASEAAPVPLRGRLSMGFR